MKPNVFPVAAIGLAGIALLFSQMASQMAAQIQEAAPAPVPKVLMVVREQIKEGREAAHAKAEEAWPRIFSKGNVSWGLFVARLSKGARLDVQMTRVNDEVWLPKRIEAKVSARLAL